MMQLEKAAADWLNKNGTFRVFATLTLKQCEKNALGTRSHITDEIIAERARRFRNEMSRIQRGRRGRISFVAFSEKGSFGGRPHIHTIFDNPKNFRLDDLKGHIEQFIEDQPWFYHQSNVQIITDIDRLLSYNLKTGYSALITEAVSFNQ